MAGNVLKFAVPKEFSELRHVLLPGQFPTSFEGMELYNDVYKYWRAFWGNVLKGNGSNEPLDEYAFLRSQIINVILHRDSVVAVHLYTVFNFQQANITTHPYLSGEHERCFSEAMRARKKNTAMALEFLTVDPEWRKSKVGISFAAVLTGLGYKIQRELKIDATLGRCRTDVKSNVLMTDVGGVTLKSNVLMHNTPVDFCALFLEDMQEHPDPNVQNIIDGLWSARADFSGMTAQKTKNKTAQEAA